MKEEEGKKWSRRTRRKIKSREKRLRRGSRWRTRAKINRGKIAMRGERRIKKKKLEEEKEE